MDEIRKKAIIVGSLILFAYAVLASSVIESKIIVMLAEALSGVAVIAIAVIMFPLFRPYNENISLGYIGFRGIEGGLMIIAGVLSLSSDAFLISIYDGIYVIHAYIFGIAALFFYYLLYQSKLIPGWLSVWGFVASILLILVNILEIAGLISSSMLFYSPIISNEVVLALWLIFKGFNSSAIEPCKTID
ncbi:hypothetical protein J2755_000215 [Methanohalophilus levihalophilus]|uniref:DUF4386 domain-containing protein n=1 Tax=Methanohalophilus levihalophilus TaxID=1431282 RepID=UPI001AE7706B|nr:DUF4386 domain-containing protein [Methanohalophilus levihalophilus]MBP2029295.1 hypothetical protein [Methanohalophilus levihalophilus]